MKVLGHKIIPWTSIVSCVFRMSSLTEQRQRQTDRHIVYLQFIMAYLCVPLD